MFIQTETMPDSDKMRFLPGRPVMTSGKFEAWDTTDATSSLLAYRLLEIPEVSSVLLDSDTIVVTKNGGNWQQLKPAVLGIIAQFFLSGKPIVAEDATTKTQDNLLIAIENKILEMLREVIDPELGYNIVDLGLIYDVTVDKEGVATVTMTTTTPGCPATGYLAEGSRACASAVDGVSITEILLTYDPPWEPDRMSDRAKAHFGVARRVT